MRVNPTLSWLLPRRLFYLEVHPGRSQTLAPPVLIEEQADAKPRSLLPKVVRIGADVPGRQIARSNPTRDPGQARARSSRCGLTSERWCRHGFPGVRGADR